MITKSYVRTNEEINRGRFGNNVYNIIGAALIWKIDLKTNPNEEGIARVRRWSGARNPRGPGEYRKVRRSPFLICGTSDRKKRYPAG